MIPHDVIPEGMAGLVEDTMADFALFCARFIRIRSKQGKMVPFILNDAQRRVALALMRYRRIVIPKARQLGVSTVCRAWDIYRAMVSADPIVLGCVSHHYRSAKHLHAIARSMLANIPAPLSPPLASDSAHEIVLADEWGGAEVQCFSASSKSGARSFSMVASHLSEYDYYPNPQDTLAAIEATVGEGQIIIESTATGPGTHFHTICTQGHHAGWYVVFLPWFDNPEYRAPPPAGFTLTPDEEEMKARYDLTDEQVYWWRQKLLTLGTERAKREYPATLEDCFIPASGAWIQGSAFTFVLPFGDNQSNEWTLEPYDENDAYAMGVDVAGGVGQDYSAITVTSKLTGQIVYQWRCNQTSPSALAHVIMDVARVYHDPMILVESNNHGHGVLSKLEDFGYNNLWCSSEGKHWVTSNSSKLAALEHIRSLIDDKQIERMPQPLMLELQSLRFKKASPAAPDGLHDDLAMSAALSYYCLRDVRNPLPSSRKQVMFGGNRNNNPVGRIGR